MLLNDCDHPLFGKDTSCHKCSGVAVWVFNGDMIGNYHFCRVCKVETGPFASSTPPPPPAKSEEKDDYIMHDLMGDTIVRYYAGGSFKTKPLVFSEIQIDTQLQMQDRMDQLLFDFMKPPGETL